MTISRRLHMLGGLGALVLASCSPLPPYGPLMVDLTTSSGERPDLSALWSGADPHGVLGASWIECSACADGDPAFGGSYADALWDWGAGLFESAGSRRRRGRFVWWFRVDGYEPVLFGPLRHDEIQEAELLPAEAPATCDELGLQDWDTCDQGPCVVSIYVDAPADLPEELSIGQAVLPYTGEPVTLESSCAPYNDGSELFTPLFVGARGYLPHVGCVPCGSEVVVSLEPHGIDIDRAGLGCTVSRPGATAVCDTGRGGVALGAAGLVVLLVFRRRRAAHGRVSM